MVLLKQGDLPVQIIDSKLMINNVPEYPAVAITLIYVYIVQITLNLIEHEYCNYMT